MEIEIIQSTVTAASCTVRVGKVYLEFDTVGDTFTRIGRYSYSRDRTWVEDRKLFREACRQASCATRSKKSEARFPDRPDTFSVTEDTVRLARKWARETMRGNFHTHEAVTEWLINTGRWTREREQEMRSLAGHMDAAKGLRTRSRKKERAAKEADAARQLEMRL